VAAAPPADERGAPPLSQGSTGSRREVWRAMEPLRPRVATRRAASGQAKCIEASHEPQQPFTRPRGNPTTCVSRRTREATCRSLARAPDGESTESTDFERAACNVACPARASPKTGKSQPVHRISSPNQRRVARTRRADWSISAYGDGRGLTGHLIPTPQTIFGSCTASVMQQGKWPVSTCTSIRVGRAAFFRRS
jgi:hypothetical protein